MDIGDKVIFKDPFSDTLIGFIMGKSQPKCKCKGMGHWHVDFDGKIIKIKMGDNRLSRYIGPDKNSLEFNFK